MSTTIRPEISKRNKWWISKHRYYELKHFCLQYPEWKKEYYELEERIKKGSVWGFQPSNTGEYSDWVGKIATEMTIISDKMALVEQTCTDADDILGEYLLRSVTEGRSYTYLTTVLEIPCGRDLYYDIYRKFFWMLSHRKHVL